MSRKILLLSPFPPRRDAMHGGCRAIAGCLAELAAANRIRVLCLRGAGEPPTEPALAELCEAVEEIHRPGAAIGWQRACLWASSLASGLPAWVGNWRVEPFRQAVRATVLQWKPDIVQFDYHVMAQYRDAVNTSRTVLVVYEPGTAAARDRVRFGPWWQQGLLRREAEAWGRYERKMLPAFDAIACFTGRDRAELQAIAPVAFVAVIPPAFGSGAKAASTGASASPRPIILFQGNFVHPPNVDAALRLARDIFPAVQASHPTAILQIVGVGPPRVLRALASSAIRVTGRVASMQPWLDTATVVALPLRTGGGIRIKTMETLCAGKALVATPLAAEGLDLHPGREFIPATTDREFADAISSLLDDPGRRSALELNARSWGKSFCRAGRVQAAFESLYARL